MERIVGGVKAIVLRIQYLGSFIYVYVEMIKFPFIHSFLHSNIYVLAIRENGVLLRARLMKLNKRACLAQLSLPELRRWS